MEFNCRCDGSHHECDPCADRYCMLLDWLCCSAHSVCMCLCMMIISFRTISPRDAVHEIECTRSTRWSQHRQHSRLRIQCVCVCVCTFHYHTHNNVRLHSRNPEANAHREHITNTDTAHIEKKPPITYGLCSIYPFVDLLMWCCVHGITHRSTGWHTKPEALAVFDDVIHLGGVGLCVVEPSIYESFALLDRLLLVVGVCEVSATRVVICGHQARRPYVNYHVHMLRVHTRNLNIVIKQQR